MLCGGTRKTELVGRVEGPHGRNGGTNHDGLWMEVAQSFGIRICKSKFVLSSQSTRQNYAPVSVHARKTLLLESTLRSGIIKHGRCISRLFDFFEIQALSMHSLALPSPLPPLLGLCMTRWPLLFPIPHSPSSPTLSLQHPPFLAPQSAFH